MPGLFSRKSSSPIALTLLLFSCPAFAAQFNFFFTSESDPNTSTPQAALQNRTNPTVRAGSDHELTLWVAVSPSVVPAGHGMAGAWLDVGEVGQQTFGSALVPNNPNNRWSLQSDPGTAGGPGYTHQGLQISTLGDWVGPYAAPADALIGDLWVYRLASGSFHAGGPGGLFLEIPFFGSVGYSDVSNWDPTNPINWYSTSGGASFGFANGAFDIQATARNYYDSSVVVTVPYRNDDPAQGFLADGVAYDGAIRTTTPDVIVVNATNPEPATLVFFGCVSAALLRRRRV